MLKERRKIWRRPNMISKPFGPKTWREIFYISESFLEDLTNFCRVSPPSSSFDSDGQCKRVEVKGGGGVIH